MSELQISKTSSGQVLSEQRARLENKYAGIRSNIFLPVTTLSTQKQWDLDSTYISTSASESQFDANGKVVKTISCATESSFYEGLVSCDAMGIVTKREENTFSYFADEQVANLPGLLAQKQTISTVPETNTYQPVLSTRVTSFDYYLDRGLLKSETVQPGSSLTLTKSYTYDAKGQILTSSLSGPDITTSTTTRIYDALNRLYQEKNALNHTATYQYGDSRFPSLATQVTSANGLVSRVNYDSFGRKLNEIRPDGTILTFNRYWCINVSTCVTGEVFKIASFETAKPDVYVFFDRLGREVRKSTLGFNGNTAGAWIDQTTEFDARSLTVKVSDPYYRGETPYYTQSAYDLLGRPVTLTATDSSQGTIRYQGRRIVTTNAQGQSKTVTKNAVGQEVEVLDTQNNAVTYRYDTLGNLSWMRDSVGNQTYMVYNERGFKVRMIDPDQGDWRYSYYADGQMKTQTDAKAQVTYFSYDILGRAKTRVDDYGKTTAKSTTWAYDSGNKALGKLNAVTSGNHTESYTYDALGRPDITTTQIDGESFTRDIDYDAYSRMLSFKYPTGLKVRYQYNNALGMLSAVTDDLATTTYWKPTYKDAKGALEAFTLGGTIKITHEMHDATGRMVSMNANVAGVSKQNLAYQWNNIGNLTYKWDTINNVNEDFQYDTLNRLTSHRTVQGTTSTTQTVQYNAIGNITAKSDVGTYSYAGTCGTIKAGPHAVTLISGALPATYCYDQNGSQTSGSGKTIVYTPFNKPAEIIRGSVKAQFFYDGNRDLYKKIDNGSTTLLVGGNYERVTASGTTQHKLYIGDYALVTQNGSTSTVNYLLRDHLGSLTAVLDKAGNVLEKLSYDAWGKRRNLNGSGINLSVLNAFKPQFSERGYTAHKHVDSMGLIHMNGRVYDPVIARFLSADPIIQAPSNLQSLNRYSYVINNPLSYTDPSGYGWLSKKWKQIKKPLITIVIVVAAVYTGGLAAAAFAPTTACYAGLTMGQIVAAGAASGAVMSAGMTAQAGGNLNDVLEAGFKGGVTGAISGAMFGTVSQVYGNSWSMGRVTGNAVAGGASSSMSGGSFKDGAKMSAILQLASGAADYYKKSVGREANPFPGENREGQTRYDFNPETGRQFSDTESMNIIGFNEELTNDFMGNLGRQGGPVSKALNIVPTINATAGLHDYWFNMPTHPEFTWYNNWGTMPAAAAISTAAVLGNITQGNEGLIITQSNNKSRY